MATPSLSVIRALGWSAFLACSWTWCIGMYFPVILIRDFGWPGWVAFAVPNVIGAMGVGLALRRPGSAARLATRHGLMMRVFSVATIVFHVWFLARIALWMLPRVGDISGFAISAAAFAMLVAALGASALTSRGWRVFGAAALGASAVVAALALRASPEGVYRAPATTGESALSDLLYVAPALAFGFLLCPALDLTINRARREAAGATGDVAFLVGFGALFLGIITLTLLYSAALVEGSWSFYLTAHMVVQSVFTMGAHLRELRMGVEGGRVPGARVWVGWTLLLGAAAALAAALVTGGVRETYLSFVALYAVAFPAYLWIAASRRGAALGRAEWIVWGVASAVTAPMLWFGGIERRWEWLGAAALVGAMTPVASRVLRGRMSYNGGPPPGDGGTAPEDKATTQA